jgi:hypothetical protein
MGILRMSLRSQTNQLDKYLIGVMELLWQVAWLRCAVVAAR